MKILTLLFSAFLILCVFNANSGGAYVDLSWVGEIPAGDKIGHLGLYGILGGLISLSLKESVHRRSCVLMLAALIIGLEEGSQYHLVERTFDLIDLLCSYIGLFGTASLVTKLSKQRGSNH